MTSLERITTADIKQAIGKGWITNVKEEDIMQNPLLARIVKGEGTRQPDNNVPSGRISRVKGKHKPLITLLIRCPKCQHTQDEYGYSLSDSPWFKCQGCGQLIPSGAWGIIALSNC